MKPLIPIALLLLVPALSTADVYKWKDAEGRTHISDRPPADREAERLNIRTSAPATAAAENGEQAAPKVIMLSTTWCGVCKRARAWLAQKGIPFTEYDVEQSETGKAEYRKLNGKGVPIILVGDQRMNGFSPERLEQMLKNKPN